MQSMPWFQLSVFTHIIYIHTMLSKLITATNIVTESAHIHTQISVTVFFIKLSLVDKQQKGGGGGGREG